MNLTRAPNRPFAFVLIAALLLSACGGGGGGSGSSSTAPPVNAGNAASSLQDAIDQAVRRGVDGAVLAVLQSDGTLTTRVAGSQNRSAGIAMDAASIFKMASVSKLYVAAAVVQLEQQGMLSLSDTIATHLPAIAPRIENSERITMRMLLRHRSGVPDFDSQSGFSWRSAHPDNATTLAFALDKPADFAPDAREEYSNTNYLLLGMIMDAVLGYSHHVQIQDFILNPLGLGDTYHRQTDIGDRQLVRGYWDGDDTTTLQYGIPGGSMLATSADIAVFLDALATGKIFDADGQQSYESVYWLRHTGWLPGYQTYARYEPSVNATVVVHVNNTGGTSEDIIEDTYNAVLNVLRR